jgi:hypothetical protein
VVRRITPIQTRWGGRWFRSRVEARWAAFYRAQIRAAEGVRERATQRLGRLLDEGAGRADPIPGGKPHAR